MRPEVPPDIVQRLDRLEREGRRLRCLLVLLPAVALAVGAGAGGEGPKGKAVVAEVFLLKDGDGRERASLALVEGTPVLSLNDADGRCRLRLAADERGFGPSLSLFGGAKGQHTVVALRQMKNAPTLQLYTEGGKPLLNAGGLPTGGGYLSVMDRNGVHADGLPGKAAK